MLSSQLVSSLHSHLKGLGSTLGGLIQSALSHVYEAGETVKSFLLGSTEAALELVPQTIREAVWPLPRDSLQSLMDFALQSYQSVQPVLLDLARSFYGLLLGPYRLFRQGLPEMVHLARLFIGGLKTVLGGVATLTIITCRILAFLAGITTRLVVVMRPGSARYAPWIRSAIFALECLAAMSYIGIVQVPIAPAVQLGGLCLAGALARRLARRTLLQRVRDSARSFWCQVTSVWRRPPFRLPWSPRSLRV